MLHGEDGSDFGLAFFLWKGLSSKMGMEERITRVLTSSALKYFVHTLYRIHMVSFCFALCVVLRREDRLDFALATPTLNPTAQTVNLKR